MHAFARIALATLAVTVSLAPAPSRAQAPPAGTVVADIADSTLRAVLGVYSSDSDPGGACTVSALDRGVLVLRGAGYVSVGTFDGREFWGVLRGVVEPVRATPAGAPAWLHAVRETDGSLAVTRWKGPAPTAVVSERWTRAGEFGRDARPDSARVALAPGDPSLPKFGEYVFVEVLPEAIHKVPPVYPDAARRARVEGTVMVQALVGRDGLVKDHRVIKSIPPLDDAAVSAIRQWRFEPARAAGKPVAVWVAVPVNFKLQ